MNSSKKCSPYTRKIALTSMFTRTWWFVNYTWRWETLTQLNQSTSNRRSKTSNRIRFYFNRLWRLVCVRVAPILFSKSSKTWLNMERSHIGANWTQSLMLNRCLTACLCCLSRTSLTLGAKLDWTFASLRNRTSVLAKSAKLDHATTPASREQSCIKTHPRSTPASSHNLSFDSWKRKP